MHVIGGIMLCRPTGDSGKSKRTWFDFVRYIITDKNIAVDIYGHLSSAHTCIHTFSLSLSLTHSLTD